MEIVIMSGEGGEEGKEWPREGERGSQKSVGKVVYIEKNTQEKYD